MLDNGLAEATINLRADQLLSTGPTTSRIDWAVHFGLRGIMGGGATVNYGGTDIILVNNTKTMVDHQ